MDYAYIVPLLALIALLAVLIFASVSRRKAERRRHDGDDPKTTFASEGPKRGGKPPDA